MCLKVKPSLKLLINSDDHNDNYDDREGGQGGNHKMTTAVRAKALIQAPLIQLGDNCQCSDEMRREPSNPNFPNQKNSFLDVPASLALIIVTD